MQLLDISRQAVLVIWDSWLTFHGSETKQKSTPSAAVVAAVVHAMW